MAGVEVEASAGRGVLAGLAGTVLSVPLLAVGFVVAEFVKRMLLSKLLGHHVETESMKHGAEAFFASIVLAFATGAIGGGAAAAIALKLMKDGARKPFLTAMAIGVALVLAALGLWLKTRLGVGTGTLAFSLLLAWLGALLGMFAAIAVEEDEQAEGGAETQVAG